MKKYVSFTTLLFFVTFLSNAQNITVTLSADGKIMLSTSDSIKHQVPFSLQFDEASFKNKTIAFYSGKNENKKIVEAKFGSDDLGKKTDESNKSIYEIKIKDDATIDLKDNKTAISTGVFYFKIDKGAFSSAIKIGNNKGASDEGIQKQIIENNDYKPGFVVNDALLLNELKNKELHSNDSLMLQLILKAYGINDNTALVSNKFLASEFNNALNPVMLADKNVGGVENAEDAVSSIFSSIGGLDVTTIADGFAKFIVKRAKQELSITFFEKLKKDISLYPDLKTVFPNTYNLLSAIDEQIYDYSNYINNLREAFRSDLLAIDENLPSIVDNHKDFFSKKNNFELGLALRTGCFVSTSLRHDMHPRDILDTYPISFFDEAPAEDKVKLDALKGSIQSLQLLSESLRESDTSTHNYWVNIDKIRKLINDEDALKIYIGLVLQVAHNKYNGVQFSGNSDLYSTLNTAAAVQSFKDDYPVYKQYILTFGSKVNELNKMIKDYEKPTSDSLKIEQYAKYFRASIQFLQYSIQVTTLPYINKIAVLSNLSEKTEKYFDITYEASDLTVSINRKRYPEAVNHLVVIYNKIVTQPAMVIANSSVTPELTDEQNKILAKQIINANSANPNATTASVLNQMSLATVTITSQDVNPNKKEAKDLVDKFISANKGDPNTTVASVINSNESIKNAVANKATDVAQSNKVLAAFAEYGAFMANIITAQSSDDVENAIEAVALPVGSAKIKRETPFNVSLNAYAGLYAGNEIIKGVDQNKPFNHFNSFGVTAPIGIALSKGHRAFPWPFCQIGHKSKLGFSSTWFISLVDLGAVAAYRFTNDTVAQVPTIQLKDIFSPGIFWSLGIAKTPLSLNFGVQGGPNLRKVNDDANKYGNNMYVRYSASICVDIPVFNFYTKSK